MRHAIGSFCVIVFLGATAFAHTPPAGYTKIPEKFGGDTFALAPDGKVAVGTNLSSNARVDVYASVAAAAASASPIRTFTDPGFKFFGDLTFVDSDTLLFSENGDKDTVYRGTISSGTSFALAPVGSVPGAAGVIVNGSTVYAVAVNDPGSGALYTMPLAGGTATAQLTDIGTGYLGGVAIDSAGNVLLTDSNDPDFVGNPGKLLRFTATFLETSSVDLLDGGGNGAYDVIVDTEGDVFVSTGSTITQIPHGTTSAEQFGSTFGNFSFISGLDYTGSGFEPDAGSGRLFVNAAYGDEGGIIGITPSPEPVGGAILLAGVFLLRRRARRMTIAATMIGFTMMTSPLRAERFYATAVMTTAPGTSQQAGFTDPALALDGPRGGGTSVGSTDVYNLGIGGSLTLAFDLPDEIHAIEDGPGKDFIVSENPILKNGNANQSFAELIYVEVSTDNVHFVRFPVESNSGGPIGPFGTIDPEDVEGFAGVSPVLANVDENAIDPFDASAAGGDAFDLADLISDPLVIAGMVDLHQIRYVRLIDVQGDGTATDRNDHAIYDPTGFGIGGADVDAVSVINGVVPEPAGMGIMSGVAIALRGRRRG